MIRLNYEKSCGAVVFTRIDNNIKYLLIQNLEGVYGFPKGHVEDGESETQTAIREVFEEVGLKIKLTTYVARHTYATVLKRSGVNIAIISESLGHSDISTTQIYLDSFENTQIDEAMKNLV